MIFDVIFLLIFINHVVQADMFCDLPANPENGKVSYLSLDYEAELYYECNSGFVLKNNQRRICSDDGTWSGSEPICQEVECDPPNSPEHGKVHILEDKFSVGNVVIYTCDEGRILVGSASSRCLDSGEWTYPTPRCVEPCFVPKVGHGKIGRYVGNFRREFEELPEGSKIEGNEELYLRCEPNYEPFGKSGDEKKVTCSDGKWQTVPVCESASCNAEELVESQGIVPGDKKMVLNGEILNVRCREGYSPSGKQALCSSGQWNVTGKLCPESSCTIHKIDNGYLSQKVRKQLPLFLSQRSGDNRFPLDNYSDVYQRLKLDEKKSSGSSVYLYCDDGYTFQGERNRTAVITCSKGKWDPDPVCLPSRLEFVTFLPEFYNSRSSCNGEDLVESQGIVPVDKKMVLHGELLNVRCREGYSPSGEQALCSSGQWNVTGKLCQESSCTIHKINNGFLSQKVRKQLPLFLSQRSGYNSPPLDNYSDVSQRLKLDEKKSSGSSVYLYCDDGYIFQGERYGTAVITCSKGKWDPDPFCLLPRPDFFSFLPEYYISRYPCFSPKIDHGKIGRYVVDNNGTNFEEVPVNTNLHYLQFFYLRCEPNYEPLGKPDDEIKVTCSRGEWDAPPFCEPARCRGPPPPTPHGNVARVNRTHGGYAVYHCRSYAKKTKSGNITCVFGNWEGVTAVCKDLRCYPKELEFPGLITGRKTVYNTGEVFSVNCEPGYNLTKEKNQLLCQDGEWKGQFPPCVADTVHLVADFPRLISPR